MGQACITDDALIASYFDGTCTDEEKKRIQTALAECADCRAHFAQLSRLLEDIPESADNTLTVPQDLTDRALSLYDTMLAPASIIDIAVTFVSGLLRPLTEGLQPSLEAGASLRGSAAESEDLSYHLTLGEFALSVELFGSSDRELELLVRPTQPVPTGWVIRLKEGEVTRTVSSFNGDGLQVDALPQGIYTICLEYQREKTHAFQLRLLTDDSED